MKKFVKRKNVPKTIEGYVKKNVSVLDVNCSGRYPNMDQAVQMFLDAAKQDLKIAIYGDYDCDGVTSLSIFTLLARALKLNNLQTIAPGRFTDGYGTFPARKPDYQAAFVFLDDEYRDPEVPPWAIKLVLQDDEI